MGGTSRTVRPGGHPAVNGRLAALVESGDLDWDDLRHREAYLRAWVTGTEPVPPCRRDEENDA